jgi:imidazolonepropionase-like amidohydrolase
MEDSMLKHVVMKLLVGAAFALLVIAGSSVHVWTQGGGGGQGQAQAQYYSEFRVPPDQVIAVRAGRMFDARAGRMLTNQVVLIRGERITDIGPNITVPPGARVVDLSTSTVLPGLIDTHVHVYSGGANAHARAFVAVAQAQKNLNAGFTTVMDMDSRGGFGTVDLRNAINEGRLLGPRMQVSGQSLNQRASSPYTAESPTFLEGFTENKNVNGPWAARAAVREAKLHGVDWVKIYTTQDFVGGEMRVWRPDATLVSSPSLTLEEVQAIVDEAHRLGLKVACHTYGGEGQRSCVEAGVDAPNHLTDLDDATLKLLLEKKLPIVLTIDDLLELNEGDLRLTQGRNSRLKMAEQSFKKAWKAGVPIVFGSGAVGANVPHGKQADQFPVLVKWGMTPAQALQTATTVAADLLNYDWAKQVGTLEKGKYADIIAVPGNPLDDITEMERVRFVMKGGYIVRDELTRREAGRSTTTAQ